MTKRDKPIDWKGIAVDLLTGKMSVREMARWYGVTEGAIRKKEGRRPDPRRQPNT